MATKEGGAITGEERLREHTDTLYGAILGYEGRPVKHHMERILVLDQELSEVEKAVGDLFAGDVKTLNTELEGQKLQPIPTGATPHAERIPDTDELEKVYGRYLWREPELIDAGVRDEEEEAGKPAERD